MSYINRERLRQYLLDLVQIDSHSREEGLVAARIRADLEALGIEVAVDDAGLAVGGDTGNVIAKIKGTVPGAPAIFLAAHMDTVVPGKGVKPVFDGDIIRTDGTTVLGGDDKSGCAIIVECLRTLKEQNLPHSDIDAVFTICEEVGLLGAKHLDMDGLRSSYGLVLDSDDVGYLFTRAPSADHMEYTIHGLEAHAGVCPENGISAIRVAAEAISAMKLGRIDFETTANIGVIEGGAATNIIPNRVVLKAEARSHDSSKLDAQAEHMRRALHDAAARHTVIVDGSTVTARVEEHITREYHAMNVADDSTIVQLVMQAASNLNQEVQTLATGGGCDANVFNQRGLEVANLGTGMQAIHTVKEWLDVNDMYRSADVVLEILKLNANISR
ncbi:MAG: M20/M25/M40 family metallo-hydrolase [Blastocatellia bacterium]|nr:M20/M25/M40 family metallo-hydrolase [Blastocatellia bacterium]